MTVDPLEIVRGWLTAGDTALSALVGSRVYYPWLPDQPSGGAGFDNTYPGVVLVMLDGSPLAETVIQSVDVEVRCFGGGSAVQKLPRDAWRVYAALRDRLINDLEQFVSGVETAGGKLISAEEVKGGTHEVEPGLKWPFVSSNWTFETTST